MMLLAKIRQALEPAFTVERELGQGGMGVVFLGRDTALDRPVAVKVLRPEIATAIATERFLLEARVLARLKHPNAVQVYQAGNTDGLLYFVMDLATGETLASRLLRGPLTAEEAIGVGSDLLAVLAESHRLGIVHRDIKPTNIFLEEGKTLLADFGIAHVDDDVSTAERLTVEGELVGTPFYMAPEQLAREPATQSADLYSLSLVLYESVTGRRWPPLTAPDGGDWSGVPSRLVPVLKRGLALSPAERWPTASAYLHALRGRRRAVRTAWVAGAAVLAGAVVWLWPAGSAEQPGRGPALVVGEFSAGLPTDRAEAVNLSSLLATSLGGLTDIKVRQDGSAKTDELFVGGTLSRDGDMIRITSHIQTGSAAKRPLFSASGSSLPSLVDSLANTILLHIWKLEGWLVPTGALPQRPEGLAALGRAELLYAEGKYNAAAEGYRMAARMDSTCVLCWFRYNDVRRWLAREIDAAGLARVRANIDRFPRHYQLLIDAEKSPFPRRVEILRELVADYPEFSEGWRRLGGELHNRGPLYGYDRAEARRSLETAIRLNPSFAPPWYDLAALLIAQGDSTAADTVAGRFISLPHELESLARAVLLQAALGFRFSADPEDGMVPWTRVRADPRISTLPELPAGPRVVQGMGTPEGGVLLGRDFVRLSPNSALHLSGLVAQLLGHSAMGQFTQMHVVAKSLEVAFPEQGGDHFAGRLWAMHAIFDDSVVAAEDVASWIGVGSGNDMQTGAWMLGVHSLRSGRPLDPEVLAALAREPDPAPRRRLIQAWGLATREGPSWALGLTESLASDPRLLEGDAYGDLFLRAAYKLSRAEWFASIGDLESARRELRWHKHFHMNQYPTAGPEVPEVDWALAALASWKTALLIDRRDSEVCSSYRTVAERWASADPPYAARAEHAVRRLGELSCGALP